MATLEEGLNVEEFYSGACILVTGFTGSVGKVIVEKLLRSCSSIDSIYVLIRDKFQLSARQRFEKLLLSQLFDKVRDGLDKVKPVNGDISSRNLNLSSEDRELLVNRVDIVLHCAANLNFLATLRTAFNNNTLSTQHVLNFCRQIKNLKSVVYMSTAYCNSHKIGRIEEKVYPLPRDLDELVNLVLTKADQIDSHIDWMALEKKLLPSYLPTTYFISKAIAENLVSKAASDLPICIVRPSIIGCCMDEPIESWVDCRSIIINLLLGGSIGTTSVVLCDPSTTADVIPLEIVAHSTILAATTVSDGKNEAKVYHLTSGAENPITWQELNDIFMKHSKASPPQRAVLYPAMNVTGSWFIYMTVFSFSIIMGLVIDATHILCAKKPMTVKMMMMSYKMVKISGSVLSERFQFCSRNTDELSARRSSKERKVFSTDVRQIHWDSYILIILNGIKRYILHEKEKISKQSQWKLKMQTLLIKSAAFCLCFSIYYFIGRITILR